MGYELIATWSTGEWSEWVVERVGRHYRLLHRVRVTGTRYPVYTIRKADALRLTSAADCARIGPTLRAPKLVTCQ